MRIISLRDIETVILIAGILLLLALVFPTQSGASVECEKTQSAVTCAHILGGF